MSRFPVADPALARRHRTSGAWDGALLDGHLDAADPGRVAVVDGGVRLTYAELAGHVARLTGGLRGLGVRPGDVVSMQLPNWWEALATHLAVIRIGAVSSPLMPILRRRELEFALRSAGSRVLLAAAEFRGFDHGPSPSPCAPTFPISSTW